MVKDIEEIGLRYGVADEAYKYYTGVLYDSSHRQVKNFPEALWPHFPERNLVPGGRELFDCHEISLLTARNDWAAFQVGVTAEVPFLLSRIRGLALSSRRGVHTIRLDSWCEQPDIRLKIQFEDLVEAEDRSRRADILSDRESSEYAAYEVGMAWIEASVPPDSKAGRYLGGIRLYESQGLSGESLAGEIRFSLEVRDVLLPSNKESPFELDLWQHNATLARMHEVERYSDRHFALLEEYVRSLAELGQKCVTIVASDIPWCGQNCHRLADGSNIYEYNMVDIVRDKEGRFHYDYSRMQRYIDLCFRYGIDRWIKVFGLVCVWADPEYGLGGTASDYPDALRLRYLDEEDGCMHPFRSGEDIDAYIQALETYFQEKGLLDRVLLSADEPADFAYYQVIIERIRRVAPGFRFFAAVNHTDHIARCRENTDSFCFILPSVAQEWEQVCAYRQQTDKTYTWYVCCGPSYPNMFLRSDLLETRLVGALTAFLGLDGFLRWDYTVWNPSPRQSLCWHLFPAGDNCFVYPGADGRPLLSLRYQQLRRAVGDYTLIDMLRRRLGEQAQPILREVYALLFKTIDPKRLVACDSNAGEVFCLDFDAFQKAKKLLLEALERAGEAMGEIQPFAGSHRPSIQ